MGGRPIDTASGVLEVVNAIQSSDPCFYENLMRNLLPKVSDFLREDLKEIESEASRKT